jgi:hypothetical protein
MGSQRLGRATQYFLSNKVGEKATVVNNALQSYRSIKNRSGFTWVDYFLDDAESQRLKYIMSGQIVEEHTHFIMYPTSQAARWWNVAAFIALILCFILTPLDISFQPYRSLLHLLPSIVVELIFMCDVGLQFFIPISIDGHLVVNRRIIAHAYLRSNFGMDLLGALPLDCIRFACVVFGGWGLPSMGTLSVLKLLRFVRFYRWHQAHPVLFVDLWVLLRLLTLLLLSTHLFACLWYGLASRVDGQSGLSGSRLRGIAPHHHVGGLKGASSLHVCLCCVAVI